MRLREAKGEVIEVCGHLRCACGQNLPDGAMLLARQGSPTRSSGSTAAARNERADRTCRRDLTAYPRDRGELYDQRVNSVLITVVIHIRTIH